MKKLTLQLRGKEQAVGIIERTLSELLQTFDITQKDSDRCYIKIILSKDHSIIIKMLNQYNSECCYIICAFLIVADISQTPIFSSIMNDEIKDESLNALSKSIVALTYHVNKNTDRVSLSLQYSLLSGSSMLFQQIIFSKPDHENNSAEIMRYIFNNMDKRNDRLLLRLEYHINLNSPEEILFMYDVKIQYTNIFGNDYYSLMVNKSTGESDTYIDYTAEEAAEELVETLDDMYSIASTAILDKKEKGQVMLYKLEEECYSV